MWNVLQSLDKVFNLWLLLQAILLGTSMESTNSLCGCPTLFLVNTTEPPANVMANDPQPLAKQLSELKETVHRDVLNHPPPYVSQQPSAPEADEPEPLFTEIVVEEPPHSCPERLLG